MKKTLLLTALFFSLIVSAQVPNQINYQGIARNAVGNVLPNKQMTVRLSIRDGNPAGSIEYREVRNITTSNLGSFNIAIGSNGAVNVTGSINSVNWKSGIKFLQVEIDPEGNSNFISVGTSQLLSVPYALFANSSNPTGNAGGDLSGTYPNPIVANSAITTIKITDGAITNTKLADNAVTTSKIVDASVTAPKLAPGVIPTSLPPSGNAGGDLSGTYPNPIIANSAVTTIKIANNAITNTKLADNAVTTSKIVDASVTAPKLAPGVIPTSLPPSGNAGGDLSGTYPNPTIANGAVTTIKIADNAITNIKLADNAVTTSKIVDASVTAPKLAPGVIPTSLPPSGNAGGDLSGTYPNPSIANNAVTTIKIANNSITNTKLADNAVTTSKIVDASVTAPKLAPGVIPTSLPPSGNAGGDLSGTYPNPTIANGAVTTIKIANNAITNTQLADNAVTTSKIVDASVTAPKLAAGVIPTTLPPSGNAGGDLSGTYPNPTIANGAVTTIKIANNAITNIQLADNAVTTSKIVDASVTAPKLAPGVIPSTLPPSGTAGGDLSGSYPNPTVNKIQGVSVDNTLPTNGQVLKFNGTMWAPGIDLSGSGGGPTGPAGGDLSGTYPNPNIASGAITTSKIANNSIVTPKLVDQAVNTQKLADNAVTTIKVLDGAITLAKLAPGVIPTSLPPGGAAGGDLSGTYPNPTVADNAITNTKLADNSVTTSKIVDLSVTASKLAAGVIPTSLPPGGAAGGDLSGTYPNPTVANNAITNTKLADNAVTTSKIVDASVTAPKLAPGVIPTTLPPTGAAGGDLSGTYPNPTVANNAITNIKLADNSVTTSKIVDLSVTASKLAAGVIPTTLPPNGTAGGDLSGSYPNPTVNKIQGITISNTPPTNGQVLKYNGSQWLPGIDNTGSGLTLPYSTVANNSLNLFSLSNQGTGGAIEGINSSTNANVNGVVGKITSTSPGSFSSAVRGINSGLGTDGYGVWGSHNGYGIGVYGNSVSGNGIQGSSTDGTGVFGTSTNGSAGYFDISNASSFSDALFAYNVGFGSGMTAISEQGNGLWGITYSSTSAGILGYNIGGGEGIVGRATSSTAAAVVGRNDGTYAGVQGIGGADNGIGVLAVANVDGFVNGNALVASIEGTGNGNPAVFMANGANVARIDKNGKGFFNGGTQVGGADVAEFFDVEGDRNNYEPGDVLVISATSDRKVEKTSTPYSTLVAGVFATKPGIMLTEKNAEKDQLDKMVPLGVIGVIPVKVCLEGGIIKRGDLLVTSSLQGVAMKADLDKVKPGQVLGKALQDFNAQSVGKINVLVSVK